MNIINHLDFDSMHGIALNTVLHFVKYWFSDEYKNHSFSLHQYKSEMNNLLKTFKYPHKVSRPIETLNDYFDWKASQLRYLFN